MLTKRPNSLLPVMEQRGIIFPITASDKNLVLPAVTLLAHGLRIQGSMPCSRVMHNKMLRFAALHGIRTIVELYPMSVDGIEEAFARLEQGKVRYRAVLVA